MSAVQNSTNLVRLSLPVNEEGSVAVDLKPTLTGLLTQEYEKQLSQMDKPREALRLVDRVYISNNVVHLHRKDGVVNVRFINQTKLKELVDSFDKHTKAVGIELLKSDCPANITQIIKEVLAFPDHLQHTVPTPPMIYGADINSYLQDKVCKVGGVVHKILCSGFMNEECFCFQTAPIWAPTETQIRQAFNGHKFYLLLQSAFLQAAQRTGEAPVMFRPEAIYLLDSKSETAPLVQILQQALLDNAVNTFNSAVRETSDASATVTREALHASAAYKKMFGEESSTDKKDGSTS